MNTWGGKRLGAGRPLKLENQTIEKVKRLSAATLLKILRDKNSDLDLRADISTKVFVKSMPQHISSDGSLAPKTVVILRNEKSVQLNESRAEQVIKEAIEDNS